MGQWDAIVGDGNTRRAESVPVPDVDRALIPDYDILIEGSEPPIESDGKCRRRPEHFRFAREGRWKEGWTSLPPKALARLWEAVRIAYK